MVLFGQKRNPRLGAIEREILERLTMGDVLVSFLCSARSSRVMYKIARERALQRYRTKKVIDSLVLKGWARQFGETLTITPSGRTALQAAIALVHKSLHTRKWDGKWRIVSFDIPEELHKLRDQIRSILKRAGFKKLQHSIWIFPHECHELTELIRADSRVKRHVLYGVLENIDESDRVRKLFF